VKYREKCVNAEVSNMTEFAVIFHAENGWKCPAAAGCERGAAPAGQPKGPNAPDTSGEPEAARTKVEKSGGADSPNILATDDRPLKKDNGLLIPN